MNQLEEKHQFMRFAICLLMVVFVVCPGMATETENLNIRILPVPGQVKIDGQTGDWDLSGGVFVCGDVENLRDQLSVWVHAMYDAENLYVLGRYRDETPLSNPGLAGADQPWTGDSLQLRIIADLQWKASNGKPAICWVNNWRDREGKDAIDIDFPWKTNAGEILKDALAKGARQALSLPKTPSILSCNDLRHLGKSGPYVSITDFLDRERSEPGTSVAILGRLRRQPFDVAASIQYDCSFAECRSTESWASFNPSSYSSELTFLAVLP